MDNLKSFFLTTIAAALQFVQGLFDTQRHRRSLDLVRSFVCVAGQKASFELSLPKDGAFELFGYNIVNENLLNGNPAPLFLMFRNSGEGSAWSNDYLPIRAIATPGAPGQPRYGFRHFWRVLSQDERIMIEYDATLCADNIAVSIVFTGKVYSGAKVVGNQVQG